MDQQLPTGKAAEILDVAERHMRRGGFDAVSFRSVAAEVGIKSASVHYHFPQKADLGKAVVRRYTDRFLAALGAPDDPTESVAARLGRLCQAYRAAVLDDKLVCLCCVLGAESQDLPEPVAVAVGTFFTQLMSWTDVALERGPDGAKDGLDAAQLIASLQGSMILALVLKRPELYSRTADDVLKRAVT